MLFCSTHLLAMGLHTEGNIPKFFHFLCQEWRNVRVECSRHHLNPFNKFTTLKWWDWWGFSKLHLCPSAKQAHAKAKQRQKRGSIMNPFSVPGSPLPSFTAGLWLSLDIKMVPLHHIPELSCWRGGLQGVVDKWQKHAAAAVWRHPNCCRAPEPRPVDQGVPPAPNYRGDCVSG